MDWTGLNSSHTKERMSGDLFPDASADREVLGASTLCQLWGIRVDDTHTQLSIYFRSANRSY